MPRHPAHGGDSYTTPLMIKVNKQMLEVLDKNRGELSRSAFMRELLREWMVANGVGRNAPQRGIKVIKS